MIELAQRRRLGRSAVLISPPGFGGNAPSNPFAVPAFVRSRIDRQSVDAGTPPVPGVAR